MAAAPFGGYREAVAGKRTNTTGLIGAWSMDGPTGDLDGFASVVDINALVAARDAEAVEVVLPPERPPLLMKPADEDDWQPLSVALP